MHTATRHNNIRIFVPMYVGKSYSILTTMAAIKPATGTHTHTITISAIAQAGKTQQSTPQVSPVNRKASYICTHVSLFSSLLTRFPIVFLTTAISTHYRDIIIITSYTIIINYAFSYLVLGLHESPDPVLSGFHLL